MDVVRIACKGAFEALVQVVAAVMTGPSAETFQTLITGWVLAPRRTILGMVRASGTERHHAAFHRLFAAASWSIDQAGLVVFGLVTSGMTHIFLTGDDTLLPRFGLKIFGTGMHRDPVLSSRSHVVTRWGHCRTVRRERLNAGSCCAWSSRVGMCPASGFRCPF